MPSFLDSFIDSLRSVIPEATTARDSAPGPVSRMGSDKSRAARPSGTAMGTARTATAKGESIDKNQGDQMEDIPLDGDKDDEDPIDEGWNDLGTCEVFFFPFLVLRY